MRSLDDGQRGNASVLTKGMNPVGRLAGNARVIPHWPSPTTAVSCLGARCLNRPESAPAHLAGAPAFMAGSDDGGAREF